MALDDARGARARSTVPGGRRGTRGRRRPRLRRRRPRTPPGRMGRVHGARGPRTARRRSGRMGRRRDQRASAPVQLRGRVPAARAGEARRGTGDRAHPGAHRGHSARVRRRLRPTPDRRRRGRRRRDVQRSRDGRPGRRRRRVHRPLRAGHGRGGAAGLRGMARARAPRRSGSGLEASVRRAPRPARRSTLGARRPRGDVAHGRPAPIGAPGRGARRREDGADPGSARPARRHGRLRGDGIAGARRSRVRRGAGRPGEAAGGGNARPGHGLGAARAPGGALRRAAPSQPARAPRCGASERGVGSDDDRRGGHPHRSRGAAGGAAARDERVRRDPAADARRGRLDRSGPPRARQRRPRRDDRRRDARPIVRPRPAVPSRSGAARQPAPTGARSRGRGRGAR